MKISGGAKEDGVVVGNAFDKYGSRNPVVRALMAGFQETLSRFVAAAAPSSIHEVGCGEGYWVVQWNQRGIAARGCDFSTQVINIARENAAEQQLPPTLFEARSIYDLTAGRDNADLIVCCEVMEHLERPREALMALQRVVDKYLILSVPREPLWRVMNFARGKYLGELGNTPGHIQHWSKADFIRLVSEYFEVMEIASPVPWTMLLCRQKPGLPG